MDVALSLAPRLRWRIVVNLMQAKLRLAHALDYADGAIYSLKTIAQIRESEDRDPIARAAANADLAMEEIEAGVFNGGLGRLRDAVRTL